MSADTEGSGLGGPNTWDPSPPIPHAEAATSDDVPIWSQSVQASKAPPQRRQRPRSQTTAARTVDTDDGREGTKRKPASTARKRAARKSARTVLERARRAAAAGTERAKEAVAKKVERAKKAATKRAKNVRKDAAKKTKKMKRAAAKKTKRAKKQLTGRARKVKKATSKRIKRATKRVTKRARKR